MGKNYDKTVINGVNGDLLFTNKIAVPGIDIISANGSSYGSITVDNTSDSILFNDVKLATATDLANKVDKVDGKGLSTNDFTTEYKNKIDANSTSISALQGAFIYIGVITKANPTDQELTARATELKGDVKLGYVLVDNNKVEYYYDGTNWNNMGQNIISNGTISVAGIVKIGGATLSSTPASDVASTEAAVKTYVDNAIANIDIPSSVKSLSFKVPTIPSSEVYHLIIEFSSTLGFTNPTIFKTNVTEDLIKFKVSTGTQITNYPAAGLGIPFIGETVFFDFSSVDESLKYFRYRWVDSTNTYSGYGFGQTDSLLQIFDVPESDLTSISVGDGLTGNGTSGSPIKLDLSAYNSNNSINVHCYNPMSIGSMDSSVSISAGTSGSTASIDITAETTDGRIIMSVPDGGGVERFTINGRDNLVLQGTTIDLTGSVKINGVPLTAGGLTTVTVSSGLSGSGTSSDPIKLDLSNYNSGSNIILNPGSNMITLGSSNSAVKLSVSGSDRLYLQQGDGTQSACNTANGLVVLGTDGKIPTSLYESGLTSISVGNGLTGNGTSASPLTVDLSNYQGNVKLTSVLEGKHEIIAQSGNPSYTSKLTVSTANITLDSDDIVIDGQASVNINSGNKVTISCTNTTEVSGNIVDITTSNLRFNSASQNTAGGIVILTSDGKLPAVDGSQLTNLPTGGLSSVSVGNGLTGDGTSANPLKVDLSNYITDDILINGNNINFDFTRFQLIGPDVIVNSNTSIFGDLEVNGVTSLNGNTKLNGDLTYNGNPLNSSGGLVMLDNNGKIPTNLYDSGSSSNTTINGLTGDVTLSQGTNVEIEKVGQDIKINTIIPTIENKSLLISLNGTNVTESTHTITYDNTTYKITVVHNLGSRVHGTLFDENNKQAFIGVDYVDDNTISMQFTAEYMPTTSKVWTLIIDATGSYLMGGNTHTIKQAVGLESRAPGVIAMSDARYEINKYSSAVSEGTLAFTYSSVGYHAQYIRTMELWINATSNITNITFDENLRNINVPTTLNMVDGSTITTHVFAVREIDGTTACISHCYSFKMS